MDYLVSIIMPCYNSEKYLDMSIGSIYVQDYSQIELIVVDDGSTDTSKSIILSWQKRFSEKGFVLKYVYQDNQGLGAAINTGLKLVTGKYLTLLDSDDKFLPGSIALRARFLNDHLECAGVRSNGWMVEGTEKRLFITDEDEKNCTDLFTALTNGKTNNWAGTYMVRSDILFNTYTDRNIYPSRLGQNFQILLPVAYKRKFGYIDTPLMEYYIYSNSHSHIADVKMRYELEEKNAMGWKDIYYNVLCRIEPDEHVRQVLMNDYEAVFCRGGLRRAILNNKSEAMKEYYKRLKATGKITLSDRIGYHQACRSPIVIPLKIVRRIKMMLSSKK